MSRSLKVILLILFLGILAYRLYYLYYGIANIITTITAFATVFLIFDLMFRFAFKSKWKKSNFRLSYWMVFICLIFLELTLRFFIGDHVQASEKKVFGSYYSPYRNILLDSKLRSKGDYNGDVGLRIHRPNSQQQSQTSEFNFTHSYNAFGLRTIEYDSVQVDSSFVILGLGDSFMEGVGVHQDSTCFSFLPGLLEDSIPNVLAINAGFKSSDPVFELYKLSSFLTNVYRPDVVVIAINETDINDIIIRGGMERFVNDRKVKYNNPPWWEYIYAFSFIQRKIVHDGLKKQWHFKTKDEFAKAQYAATTTICKAIYEGFYQLSKDKNFELIANYTPMQHEIENNWKSFNGCDSVLTELNIKNINLLEPFQNTSDDLQSYFWKSDRHYTAKGHELWAKELAEEILRLSSF